MKHYLCGNCGKLDTFDKDGNLCQCGADNFIEYEDLSNPELFSHIERVKVKLGLTLEQITEMLKD